MAKVDPFVIKWPAKWVKDPELRDVLFYLNKFLHDLWIRTGGGTDFIEDARDGSTNIGNAYNHKLQQQIGSGDFLTSDDTGFTVDSVVLTVDMDEA